MRRLISVLVVVGLALAVVLLWANRGGDSSPGTQAQATTTTLPPASTTLPPDTTTLATTTTSSPTDVEIVETVEQAEAILRELWFGWFEGIYNEDEDRIREVVVLEETVATAREAFGEEFLSEPHLEDITFSGSELLRADAECLAVLTEMRLTNFRDGSSQSVHVVRSVGGEWRRLSLWQFEEDMWEQDCDSQLSSPSP